MLYCMPFIQRRWNFNVWIKQFQMTSSPLSHTDCVELTNKKTRLTTNYDRCICEKWIVCRSNIFTIHNEYSKRNGLTEFCDRSEFEFPLKRIDVMSSREKKRVEFMTRSFTIFFSLAPLIFHCAIGNSKLFSSGKNTDHRVIWMSTDQFNPRLRHPSLSLLHRTFIIMQTKVWPIQFIMYRCTCVSVIDDK